jgi:hypothetical protein
MQPKYKIYTEGYRKEIFRVALAADHRTHSYAHMRNTN